MTANESIADEWLRLIRAEYLEVPGLDLTRAQASCLWELEPHLCDALLDALVASDFLTRTPDDTFVLSDSVACSVA
jgi:hypothetical protein